ncbi:MAG TPA: M57 family metalloprotease [Nitrososphaeraceae archaeon]|nr:M57 family metalloprotease [Nitrososphaeraceae archaeon]
MKIYTIAILIAFFFIVGMLIFDADLANAKNDDSKKKKIELCCTWGDSLDDGILTFSIDNGGSDLAKIVKVAINDWEKSLKKIEFKYVKNNDDADIKIEFKKGKGKKVGKTVTYFDPSGLIDQVDISISKKSYGVTLNSETLEHVAKHELGHALGLGHANYKNTLMSPNVDEIITKISACEIASVKYANSWKLGKDDNDGSPSPLDNEGFKCKKKQSS